MNEISGRCCDAAFIDNFKLREKLMLHCDYPGDEARNPHAG
ncbi:hypothetical protein [Bradyrhizobium genosp. P]